MNYREPLTKNEIREHAAHYENSNPAVYCGTYAKYNNGRRLHGGRWAYLPELREAGQPAFLLD